MQADWEIEIGADAPIIDADWPGFIDLELKPELAQTLEEARFFPPLAAGLVWLNRPESPIRTSKCDLWEPEEFDRDELDAPGEPDLRALACYIDLLPQNAAHWTEIDDVVRWCKLCCAALQEVTLRSSRVDLVVRSAVHAGRDTALGVTAYLLACGRIRREAQEHLDRAIAIFAHAVAPGVSRASPQE